MAEYYLAYENQNEQKLKGRITEQLVEQEFLEIVEENRVGGIKYIENSRDDANAYIEEVKTDTNDYITDKKNNETDGVVKTGENIKGDIHFKEGDVVDEVILSAVDKGTLGNNYTEAKQIYQDTLAIAPDTEDEIEATVRNEIANKYEFSIANDGNGNVVVSLNKKVI